MSLLVYGATGATGRRVVGLAAAAGVPVIAAGRRPDALRALGVQWRAMELDALDFTGATVVVSCAGPYTHLGPAVLAAAIRAGASYVDCSGEPRWVQSIADRFEADAIARGVAIVPALGGGVVTDLAAASAGAGIGTVRRMTAAVRIIGMRPSLATVRSTVELVAGGAPVVEAGQVRWERPGGRREQLSSGPGTLFCSPDAILLARAFPDAHVECHMQPAVLGPALAACSSILRRPRAMAGARRLVARGGGGSLSDHAGGGRVRSTADAVGDDGRRSVIAEADDIYEITGRSAFGVARRLAEGVERPGLQPASAVLGDLAAAAEELGVQLQPPEEREP